VPSATIEHYAVPKTVKLYTLGDQYCNRTENISLVAKPQQSWNRAMYLRTSLFNRGVPSLLSLEIAVGMDTAANR